MFIRLVCNVVCKTSESVSSQVLKLINNLWADAQSACINLVRCMYVDTQWTYLKNIIHMIKTHLISPKTDQDADQETWILINLHWILINEYLLVRSNLNSLNTDSNGYLILLHKQFFVDITLHSFRSNSWQICFANNSESNASKPNANCNLKTSVLKEWKFFSAWVLRHYLKTLMCICFYTLLMGQRAFLAFLPRKPFWAPKPHRSSLAHGWDANESCMKSHSNGKGQKFDNA